MARREIVLCDRCGRETPKDGSVCVEIHVGHCPIDGSGQYERLDLCGKCASYGIGRLLGPLDFRTTAEWLAAIRRGG